MMTRPPLRHSRLVLGAALSLLAACALAGGAAPKAAPSPTLDKKQLTALMQQELAGKGLRGADVGVALFDLVSREMVFAHNADRLLAVASNNKLVTTAAALELLGADFQFRTSVAAVGKMQGDGTLKGDLLVIGRGDPNISGRFHDGKTTAVLEGWAKAVAAAGIKTVRGDIVADDSYFDRQYTHPDWPEPYTAWYRAGVCALSLNDSCVDIIVRPSSKSGNLAIVTTDPATSYVRVANTCRTSRSGNRVIIHRLRGRNQISVSGTIHHRRGPQRSSITIHDPARYTATVFREVLQAKGIKVAGLVRLRPTDYRFRPDEYHEIVTTTSSLADSVAVANTNSQNFYAEQMLKTLGREKQGKGSFIAGAAAVAAFLREAGVRGVFAYADGSGLGRNNRFTPRQITALLAYMNCRRTGSLYWHSLAQPGQTGTLRRRSLLLPLQGRLAAKTGYINGVSALSGYVETLGGRLLAFSVLVNGFRGGLTACRIAQDRICLHASRYAPKRAE